jgi:hypothetical protein
MTRIITSPECKTCSSTRWQPGRGLCITCHGNGPVAQSTAESLTATRPVINTQVLSRTIEVDYLDSGTRYNSAGGYSVAPAKAVA